MNQIDLPVFPGFSLQRTLSGLGPGRGDPSMSRQGDTVALCLLTPKGTVSVHAQLHSESLGVELYGDGSDWLQPHLPDLFGLNDDVSGFEPRDRLRRIAAASSGIRLPCVPVIFHRLVQVVLHQLVSWEEAADGWKTMTQRFGESAPGPGGLTLGPTPERLRGLAYYDLVNCGVLPRQARLIIRLAAEARRIEKAAAQGNEFLTRFLRNIPGIGEWTVQSLLGSSRGHADAVVTGDYGLHHAVCYFFRGQERGTDEEMLELLEPYRGHRYRVQSLIMHSGISAPRRGPKMAFTRLR